MAKVIVTGGAGFIGSHLCDALLSLNHDVTCVDNFLTSSEENITHLKDNSQFHFIHYDVTEVLPDEVEAEVVFHLASPASPNHHSPISYHALPMETMMANTRGTMNMLKFASSRKAKFLFTSTSEVYGDPLEHPQKETYRGNVSTIGPRSVYDEAKRFGETLVSYFWREKDLDARIARIFNTYGPRMSSADMRMISIFITEAVDNKPITIYGDGKQTRSLCYVSDTVDGLIRLMFEEKTQGEVVNIGSPDEHTVIEYAELVKKLVNSTSEIELSEKLPEDDPMRRRADITKAKELLGWEPKVTLEEGLQKMIEYVRKAK
jgi:nucleoside-diphosphate-sugar epimerase